MVPWSSPRPNVVLVRTPDPSPLKDPPHSSALLISIHPTTPPRFPFPLLSFHLLFPTLVSKCGATVETSVPDVLDEVASMVLRILLRYASTVRQARPGQLSSKNNPPKAL